MLFYASQASIKAVMLKGMTNTPKEVLEFLREIGSKGGKERSRKLTEARRKVISGIASEARWGETKSGKRGRGGV